MKVDDIVELEIERMSFGPSAVGRYRAPGEARPMVIFVDGALPGEKVRTKLTKNHKSYWEGQLVEVLSASNDRITPPCPVFKKCGGCQWQHLAYPAQVRAKEEILLHQLERSLQLPSGTLRPKLTTHPAKEPVGYRSRLQVHGDRRGIGFFASGSHSIVYTEKCVVAHPDIQRAWSEFLATRPLAEMAKATGQFKVEWTRTGSGQIKEAINRKHGALGFTQVNLEQNDVLVDVVTRLAGSGELLLDLFGGDGNLSNKLIEKFSHVVSVDTFNSGVDPASLKNRPGTGRTFVKEPVEDFLVDQRWREWGFERMDCVIVDPPRTGLRETASLTSRLPVSRMILVSCDPSTLARDLTAFTDLYSVDQIHLIDMFPQTYHMETVVLLTAH